MMSAIFVRQDRMYPLSDSGSRFGGCYNKFGFALLFVWTILFFILAPLLLIEVVLAYSFTCETSGPFLFSTTGRTKFVYIGRRQEVKTSITPPSSGLQSSNISLSPPPKWPTKKKKKNHPPSTQSNPTSHPPNPSSKKHVS